MKNITVTDSDIAIVIQDLKHSNNQEGFKEFMRERMELTAEHGQQVAESMLKDKHADKISNAKAKKTK